MKVGYMKYLPFIVLLVGIIITAGCISPNQNTVDTPTPQIVYEKVTVTPTLSPAPSLKTVLFSDDLSNWRSEWDKEYDYPDGKTFYSGGSLHIRDNDPPTGAMYHTLNKNFNDFFLDVDTKTVAGTLDNWQTVYIRESGEKNYYDLGISADGYYGIQKMENGNLVHLSGTNPTRSSYINTGIGATNHMQIEADKNTLSLSVNGHHLQTVTDNSFKEGTVSLGANCKTSNSFTEVSYNNLVITTI